MRAEAVFRPCTPSAPTEQDHLDEAHKQAVLELEHCIHWFKKWAGIPGAAAEIRKLQTVLATELEKLV